MADEGRAELDWIHLPQGVEPASLWDCLHDAALRAIRSDPWQRSVMLEFDVFYIREHHHLPDNCLFEFYFTDIRSVRAITYSYPDPPKLNGMSIPAPPAIVGMRVEDKLRLKGEYVQKGRYETVTWGEFEKALADAEFEVHDAEIVQGEEVVTLRLWGMLGGEDWHQLVLRASRLSVHRSDDVAFSLDDLIALGNAYWEAFSQRREELKRLQSEAQG
jgi:hypothetical protein